MQRLITVSSLQYNEGMVRKKRDIQLMNPRLREEKTLMEFQFYHSSITPKKKKISTLIFFSMISNMQRLMIVAFAAIQRRNNL
jgi:hypothetical protein